MLLRMASYRVFTGLTVFQLLLHFCRLSRRNIMYSFPIASPQMVFNRHSFSCCFVFAVIITADCMFP